MAVCRLIFHRGGSGTSVCRSCPPAPRSPAAALCWCPSQTVGTWRARLDRRTSGLARTTGSEGRKRKCILGLYITVYNHHLKISSSSLFYALIPYRVGRSMNLSHRQITIIILYFFSKGKSSSEKTKTKYPLSTTPNKEN